MDIFDIIGPVMVGPSSSHTAGAVRIGYIAGKLMEVRFYCMVLLQQQEKDMEQGRHLLPDFLE